MRCRIDKRGKQVFTPQNERSKLFDKLHNITGDFQKALDIFGITETSGFKEFKNRLRPINKLNSTDPIVFQSVLERLQQSGLSDNIFQLNTEQLNQKLIELGVSAEVRNQIQAWHGSPHLFQKFSTQFMGSGEGMQAFGWGLYFTELKSIARGYAAMNSSKVSHEVEKYLRDTGDYVHLAGPTTNTVSIDYAMDERRGTLEQNLDDYGLSVKEYIEIMERQLEDDKKHYDNVDPSDSFNTILKQEFEKNLENVEAVLNKIRGIVGSENLYNVTLHKDKTPDQYTWLEWDKRLSDKQRDLIIKQAQLEGLSLEEHTYPSGSKGIILKDKKGHLKAIATNGKQIYEWLHQSVGGNILQSDKEVSLFLLRAGIDGIRYPAESISRGATSDNARGFNYVVFDENAVTIEETIQFQKEGVTLAPNGFVVTENGKRNIYLNSDNLNLDTLLHENGHLFLDTLKQRFPEHYQAGLELLTKNSVEAQPYIDYVNSTQPNLEKYSEAWKNEVLAQIIGSKGEQLIKSRKKNTIKEWLHDFWDFIAKSFGLTSYTPSEVANMTLQEFSDAVNVEMLSGNQINTTEQEAEQIKTQAIANGTFMKAPNGKDTNLNERQWLQVRTSRFALFYGNWNSDPRAQELIDAETNRLRSNIKELEGQRDNIRSTSEFDRLNEIIKGINHEIYLLNEVSVLLDENGEPMVLYHGTSEEFSEFKLDANKKHRNGNTDGFYFTSRRELAESAYGENVKEVFLSLKNPVNRSEYLPSETSKDMLREYIIEEISNDESYYEPKVGYFSKYGESDVASTSLKREMYINDGYDGLIDGSVENGEVVVFYPNQIKSATDNAGTFSSESNDIRFQIIGEIGAEALDRIEDATNRIDNLDIAKQMTESGKMPLEIRLATGWELGVDGKWKYEVDDFKIKNVSIILDKNHEYFDTKVGIYELKDLVDVNNEVFKAYPEIKNQQIVFVRGFSENTNMIYSNGTIFISYEKFNENGRFKDREGTLLHEVQHHLQDVEGFARGGNDQQYKPQVIEYFRQLKEGVRSGIFKNGSESKLARIIEEELNKRVDSVDRELVIAFQDPIAINSISFGVYKRLAGEVEARNVQERLKLNPQQRKQKLLSETADVREEDQLVIFDAFEQADSISYETFQNNNLRSHMFVENNSKLGSIRTKPTQRGEKVDSAIVYEAYRGQGVGTELYLETVRNLMVEGKILESDNSQTAPAKRIWEKLVEWGLAIKTGESNFESVPAPSWMTAETTIDEVINNQPIDRSEPSLQELMTYINFQGDTNVTKTEVIELMQANEILDSHELLERLSRAEEQGIFIFTLERLKQTSLFENYEAHKILESKERQGKIKDTLKWLRQNDNFEIQPTQLEKGGSLLSTGKIERQAEESEVTVQDLEGNQVKSNVRLSETITFDYNETLSNNIAFLNQIVRETTWDNLSSQVKDILSSIEVSALDNGIDLKGLSEKYHSATREDILGFLNSLENTLEGNTSPQEFEANRNEFLNFDSITENKEVSRTEVVLGDRLDADVALRDYNLLKVAPDVYKRVPSITYTELLQAEANRRGVETEVLNREVNENFDRSLEDVEQAKLIYLLNSNLNTQETKIQPNLSKLDTFQGNFDYIVEQFPKDFGKWVIETNNNYFKLDWRGITLINPNQSELAFESVPDYFKEDLLEYSKLSKYLNFNREFDLVYDLDSLQIERDRVINNAQALEEYKGDYVTLKNGEGIMIRNGQGQFIKLNGLVFEQVDEHNNLVFYKPLPNLNEDSLMEIEIPKPVLESNVFDYTLYQTQAKEIENLNRETNRTDYEC